MQEKIKQAAISIKEKWQSLELKHKIYIIATTIVLLVALILIVFVTTRPKMAILVEGQDSKTLYQIQTALEEVSISSNVVRGETALEVKQADYSAAKRTITESGVVGADFTFADALDSMSMGTTSDVKKAIMSQQKQRELESQLAEYDSISKATVSLNIPDDTNFFIESNQVATAAVALTLKKDLTDEQIHGVASYILSSVKGLEKENLIITDSKANILFSGEEEANGSYGSQYKIEAQKKSDIEKSVKQLLAQNYDDVKVMSNLVFDWDKTNQVSETYSAPTEGANKGIITDQSLASSSVKTNSTSDEPGLNTNGGDITQYATGENGNTEAKSDDSDTKYAVNSVKTSTEKQTGALVYDQSSMSVTVYKIKTYDQEVLEARGELADLTWTEYKEQVEMRPLTISNELKESVAIATGIDIDNIRLIGYELPNFVDKIQKDSPIEQYALLVILVILLALLAFALIKKTSPVEITEFEPELSVEQVLSDYNKKQEYVSPIDYDADSEIKKQIEKFVDERPESVAQLLRNWLSDEWE